MRSRIVYRGVDAPKKRKTIPWTLPAVIAGAALLIMVGIVYLIRLPAMQIRDVAVTGTKTLDEQGVRERIILALAGARALIFPRSSFFLADAHEIAYGLRHDFPRIRDIAIAKKFPDKLDVTITERVFWGVFCNGRAGSSTAACVYIDSDGIAYEYALEPQGKLIISIQSDGAGDIALGAPVIDPAIMGRIRGLAEKIPVAIGSAVVDFELHTRVPSEIRAIAADGVMMIFKREDDYAATLGVLKRVLDGEIKDRRSRLDYIDLRFGNKVFYKLK